MQKICLVVPCYNEEKRLRTQEILDRLKQHEQLNVCLVNDGSSDGTATVLETLRRICPERIEVLNFDQNSGKAEAVRQGVIHVSSLQRYELIGYWDADFSTPLEELQPIVQEFTRRTACQFAMGSRMKRLGSQIERSAIRHILGRVFATFASLLLRLPVYDSQCGAKLFRADLVEVLFRDPFLTRWLFDVEILARYRNHVGTQAVLATTVEVPLSAWIEVHGSKLTATDLIYVPMELLKIWIRYKALPANTKSAKTTREHSGL